MVDNDGNLAAKYDKNEKLKRDVKIKKIKELAAGEDAKAFADAKEKFKQIKVEEVKEKKHKAAEVDSFIQSKGFAYDTDLSQKANIVKIAKSLGDETAFGLQGEPLAKKIVDRLRKIYQAELRKLKPKNKKF